MEVPLLQLWPETQAWPQLPQSLLFARLLDSSLVAMARVPDPLELGLLT